MQLGLRDADDGSTGVAYRYLGGEGTSGVFDRQD
jgi:hypothetical protein